MTDQTDLLSRSYVVTHTLEFDGMHFLHTTDCQVLPDTGLVPLGDHHDSVPAREAAEHRFDKVQACALCCPDSRDLRPGDRAHGFA